MTYSNKKKGVVYYVRMFISATIAIILVAVLSELTGWPSENFMEAMQALIALPFFIVVFLLIFNLVSRKSSGPIDKREAEHHFVMRTSKKVREELNYTKEDFQKLQESEKFQKFYQDVYTIFAEGENETLTLEQLSNRFGEDEFGSDAVEVVIKETQKIIEETKKKEK